MTLKFLAVVSISIGILSCAKKEENKNVDDFKSKVIGHWYCAPDSDYQEVIFTDSAFLAHGMRFGTMFRYVKYVSPDSLHFFYDNGERMSKCRISFKDSTMIATFSGGQTTYSLITRLTDHGHDYQILFSGNEQALNILHAEWLSRMSSWISGVKFSQWQVNEIPHSLFEKENLLNKVDDSFIKAMLMADSSYKKATLPLFHFFDADFDGREEIAFWGTAGASDAFFNIYKAEGEGYYPWIHEYGKLIYCASFRDTTWVEIYSPVMVGDGGASDSLINFTIAKNFKKRKSK